MANCFEKCEPVETVTTEYVSDGWQCWCNFEGYTTTPPTIGEAQPCNSWTCGDGDIEPPDELNPPTVELGGNTFEGTEVIATSNNGTTSPTYIIYDTTDDSVVTSGASPLTITGLNEGETYESGRFVVVEVVDGVESSSTPIPEFRVPYEIFPPTVESVTPTDTTASIEMNSGNGITGSTMILYLASDDSEVTSSTSPLILTGLEPETTYPAGTWYVREQTGDGLTDPVDVPEFTTLASEGGE